ncbi:adenylyl-sulfate kinase [Roseivirga spongicola]|uniref:adenylyl-sulfate kinase n=1 Tax=Roseivirga spongicola TaxID=333140 RepID=UPI0009FF83DA|nr:adenylyl-sulfate kinase [Roseivirga spongicola]WPZ11917.1 adenylyl-sulfate kinase [Roseivirga spongicola]
MADSRVRHLAKTVTWRIVGTIDTMILAWIISGSPITGLKIGAAEVVTKMVLYYLHERVWYKVNFGLDRRKERRNRLKRAESVSENIIRQNFKVDRTKRQNLLNQRPLLVWFTGLSGSGKSTLSNLLEVELHESGYKTYALDGDNIRQGLCNDLAFTEEDRVENIRRIGEVARLFLDSGVIVLNSFVSPFEKDREAVRNLVGSDNFIEVFVDCPLEVCEARDVKGLYKKAREGKIRNFTGITSPFEVPQKPDVIIKSAEEDPKDSLHKLLSIVEPKISIRQNV